MKVAGKVALRTAIKTYPLESANEALSDLRCGALEGAAVLLP
jgi:propanol-preferring alcohol dehydrogenase